MLVFGSLPFDPPPPPPPPPSPHFSMPSLLLVVARCGDAQMACVFIPCLVRPFTRQVCPFATLSRLCPFCPRERGRVIAEGRVRKAADVWNEG